MENACPLHCILAVHIAEAMLDKIFTQQPLHACAQDTSWLDVHLSEIPHVVYDNADPRDTQGAQHKTLLNKGNEAMGYLQFIVDYYERLPASIAFIHGHRWAAAAASKWPTTFPAPQHGGMGHCYHFMSLGAPNSFQNALA